MSSYSYVTTVFPNFKNSNIYDQNLYNNISVVSNDSNKFIPSNLNNENIGTPLKPAVEIIKPNELSLETFYQTIDNNNSIGQGQGQDNLKYYNKPLPSNLINNQNHNTISSESFSQNLNHELYIKHILECEACKNTLLKQFNIDNDRMRNEEILELVFFIILGIFILLLLEKK